MKRVMFVLLLCPALVLADGRRYLDTIPVFWRTLYPDGGSGLYCGARFGSRDRRYNIEHVYPMSWVAKALRCGDRQACRRKSKRFNEIESDMHNMYPARKDLNRERGSYPFRELRGERHVERGCDLEIDHRARAVEPRPAVRGDIARAMLYIADRYDMKIYERQRRTLLRWHSDDPPDAAERRRNRRIADRQGNPNPWIDR
ncbi:MAG: endonuclease [Gammaproteobacteria bacterium]|nr:endonuclease [Gammaproteobacteria bacterium]